MRTNDKRYAEVLKTLDLHPAVFTLQATATLVKTFSITEVTASRALDRILNGSIDRKGLRTPPLLIFSKDTNRFLDVDLAGWRKKQKRFALQEQLRQQGKLAHISLARHKRRKMK